MPCVVLIEIGEQARLGEGEVVLGALEVGAPLFGDQHLARPPVAGVGPAVIS
ncbi:hypothetical protein [Streptomyces melanosporofaciens]|uniref:hypothetical protein n=1 Tax=Streptomyces melanosporofaciens TaxID=67327 RepID=UPI0014314865|nr:hypothetical protein [Streptomyces melanosporofaciens]